MFQPDAPDFILLGVPRPNGVTIYASTSLTEAELRSETEIDTDPYDWEVRPKPGRTTFFINATMREFVVSHGPTYADALWHLMETWKPEQPERQALPGRRALER